MANFALNYSFSRNLGIPLDEDAVKTLRSDVLTYVQTKSKCYAGQIFSVVGDTEENNGLYIAIKTGEEASVVKLASQEALEAVADSAGKIDSIQLNGTELTINDKTVNIDLKDYATVSYVDEKLKNYATKSEVTEQIVSAMTGGEIELTGYAKVEDVEAQIASAKTEISEYTDSKISGLSEVYATKSDLDNFQTTSEELVDGKISGLSEVYASKDIVDTLVGEDSGLTVRSIAAQEVANLVASADSSFDTLKEIADWILNDTEGAASMANDIAELKSFSADTRLEALETDRHNHENKEVIDGISAEKVAAWDSAVSISNELKTISDNHEERLDVLEGATHIHTNKDVIDAITSGQVSSWDSASEKEHEHENKEVIDSISAEKVAAWDSASEKEHEHENKEVIDGISAEKVAAWDSASEKEHEHENKEVIDGISAEKVAAWDSAYEKEHEHENKEVIDGISEERVTAWDSASEKEHEHENKEVIDGISAEKVTAWDSASEKEHEHENKEVIDGISAEKVAAWDSASEKEHEHENKEVIDGISAEKVTAWDSAEQNAKDYADGLANNYDSAGAAISALTESKGYTDEEIAKLSDVYDSKGSAETAKEEAISASTNYFDEKIVDYAPKSYVTEQIVSAMTGGEIELTGYAKIEDVKSQIASAKTEANEYTDSKISGLSEVYASKDVVETLVGEDEGLSMRSIAAQEVASIVASADSSFDTLKEIADWILNDTEGAASMANDIAELKSFSADTRLEALETDKHNHENKELLDTYTQTNDDLADAVSKKHEHENKEVIDGISAEKVTAWDSAEQNAKDYADGLVENIKPYTSGVATSIEENVVNVKVSESEDNFLEVNENNELEVKEITLDAAKTSKDIVVEGGQWADAVKTVYGSSVPAGTTWESFLEAMLCVEKFAGTISTSSAFTVSCGNINPGIDKSGTVEVGTKVTLNKTTANATTASQSLTAKTFTYGYKLGEDGDFNNSTAYTETLTPTLTESNDALKITFSNFKDAVNDGESISEKTGNGSIDSVEMYAMEGTNKVTVYQTGDTYTSSSAVTAGTIYVATNLKNYYKTDKIADNTYTPSFVVTSKTASDSTEYTVTGAHKYFIGDVTDYSDDYWNDDRSEVIRGLGTTGWATGSTISKVEHTFKVGTKQQTVVIPSAYNSVSAVDANNGTVTFNFVKEIDFTNAQGYISKYKVYVAPSKDGLSVDSKIIITISK